jgi:ATP-dependent Clp protease adaptor protein ClpS
MKNLSSKMYLFFNSEYRVIPDGERNTRRGGALKCGAQLFPCRLPPDTALNISRAHSGREASPQKNCLSLTSLFFIYSILLYIMPVHINERHTDSSAKKKEKLREPNYYRVVLLNDNYTTMDFVVEILMSVFHKNGEDAERIMLDVHRKGRGVVGVYTLDIAQTKANQVHILAREREFPLKCIVEKQ